MGFRAGDRILAQWEGGMLWFPGTVHGVNADTVAILYDDGMSEIRPENQVKPFDWWTGTRIEAIWPGDGGWYPARVMEISTDGRTLTARFEDGTREEMSSACCRSR